MTPRGARLSESRFSVCGIDALIDQSCRGHGHLRPTAMARNGERACRKRLIGNVNRPPTQGSAGRRVSAESEEDFRSSFYTFLFLLQLVSAFPSLVQRFVFQSLFSIRSLEYQPWLFSVHSFCFAPFSCPSAPRRHGPAQTTSWRTSCSSALATVPEALQSQSHHAARRLELDVLRQLSG